MSPIVAADSAIRHLQGARSLSRLLVLDTARPAAAIAASVEAESRARIRRKIQTADFGRDRNLLRGDGLRDEKAIRSHLFNRVCTRVGRAGAAEIRAPTAHYHFLR